MDYRREIDGLRALAVLPVMLFHAGFEAFAGGFVGVDVFFVISGYLITTIIISELQRGTFSLLNFYERRARRILPALFVVMLVSIVLAWFWLLPADMKNFSQSLAAVTVFASNFLFWRESGYFDAAAELKPLLHTWSLAVEEQYYVFFPLFLMALWRLGKRCILLSMAIMFVASLLLAEWMSAASPAAAFFLMPTRIWELLIGAFAAFYLSRASDGVGNARLAEAGGWIGVLMILLPVFWYSKTTPFPGLYALVPTVGALLIILFATQQTLVGRFVGNRVFVGIGLISYSAYLWHQPLFAFARYMGFTSYDKLVFAGLCVLALVLAVVSWKFIEQPFRDKTLVGRRGIFAFALVGSAMFGCLGVWGHLKKGDVGQINSDQREFVGFFENARPEWRYTEKMALLDKYRADCDFYDIPGYRAGSPTVLPRPTIAVSCYTSAKPRDKLVFVWGDSHAQQLHHGLRATLPADIDVLQVASSGCPARLDAKETRSHYCEYSNWFALKSIKNLKPRVVVIGQDLKHSAENMDAIARELLRAGVQKVVFTGPSPHWSPSLPASIALKFLPDTPRYTFSGMDKNVLDLDARLKSETDSLPHLTYVSLTDYFCRADGCLVYYGDKVAEGVSAYDYGHLTPIASLNFARDVLGKAVME